MHCIPIWIVLIVSCCIIDKHCMQSYMDRWKCICLTSPLNQWCGFVSSFSVLIFSHFCGVDFIVLVPASIHHFPHETSNKTRLTSWSNLEVFIVARRKNHKKQQTVFNSFWLSIALKHFYMGCGSLNFYRSGFRVAV